MSCRTGPLRAARSLRDLYIASLVLRLVVINDQREDLCEACLAFVAGHLFAEGWLWGGEEGCGDEAA
jgi:hypothetical protein